MIKKISGKLFNPWFMVLLCYSPSILADTWNNDPRDSIDIGISHYPAIVTDGNSGWITAGFGTRNSELELVMQSLDSSGEAQWSVIGKQISNGVYGDLRLVSDGAGGAIVVWTDRQVRLVNQSPAFFLDIYAQRINNSGDLLWPVSNNNGLLIHSIEYQLGETPQTISTAIASDNNGGIFITWKERRNGAGARVYVQHLNGNGTALLTEGGERISATESAQLAPVIISTGSGDAIIAWEDSRDFDITGPDLYAQRINANGIKQWAQDALITNQASTQWHIKAVSDGFGGAIFVWNDPVDGSDEDILAQKLDSNGIRQWDANQSSSPADYNGITVVNHNKNSLHPSVVPDGLGGVVVAWQDGRSTLAGGLSVFVQHLDFTGIPQWPVNGAQVSSNTIGSSEYNPEIISDGSDGWIIIWDDYRNTETTGIDIFAQRIDSNATPLWTSGGIAVTTAPGDQSGSAVVTDTTGGAVVIWRNNLTSSGAQRINNDGSLTHIETVSNNPTETPADTSTDENTSTDSSDTGANSTGSSGDGGGSSGNLFLLLLLCFLASNYILREKRNGIIR